MCTKFDNYVFVESFVNIKNIKNGLKYFNATFLHENDLHYVKKFAADGCGKDCRCDTGD